MLIFLLLDLTFISAGAQPPEGCCGSVLPMSSVGSLPLAEMIGSGGLSLTALLKGWEAHGLLVLDDVLTSDLRNNDTVTKLFTQGRHSRISVMLVSQAWSGALAPAVRKNADLIFLLRCRSGIENKMIRDESIKGCIAPDDVGRVRLPSGVVPDSEERLARGTRSAAREAERAARQYERMGTKAQRAAAEKINSALAHLKEKGVVLAICSKNDEAHVREAFEQNREMLLSLDDVAVLEAGGFRTPCRSFIFDIQLHPQATGANGKR